MASGPGGEYPVGHENHRGHLPDSCGGNHVPRSARPWVGFIGMVIGTGILIAPVIQKRLGNILPISHRSRQSPWMLPWRRQRAAQSEHWLSGEEAFEMILRSSLIDPQWSRVRQLDVANGLIRRFQGEVPDAVRDVDEGNPPDIVSLALASWLHELALRQAGLGALLSERDDQ